MPRRSDFLLDMTEGQIRVKAALEVAVGIAVLIVIGASLILPFLPIGH